MQGKQHDSWHSGSCWLTWLSFAFTPQWKISESWVPCQGVTCLTWASPPPPPGTLQTGALQGHPDTWTAQTWETEAELTPRHTLSVSSKQSTMKISELHGEIFGNFLAE